MSLITNTEPATVLFWHTYAHTNWRACSVHGLKTCWLYLVVKLCLAVVDFRLLHFECGTVYHKNLENVKLKALLKSILTLTYSARTLSSQPLMRFRLWFYNWILELYKFFTLHYIIITFGQMYSFFYLCKELAALGRLSCRRLLLL